MAAEKAETRSGIEASRTPGQAETCCPVIELRQYRLKPGRRDELIALFEEHFLEGQERYGYRIIGQFRRRGHPDFFVWLRGFGSMEARRIGLEGFYFGPIWQAHRSAANDTMVDSDNVLLLKPVHPAAGFCLHAADRPPLHAPETAGGIILATVYSFATPVETSFIAFFETKIAPALSSAGATLLGQFVTESSENTFPRLPVREGEHVFVWFASFADEAAYAAYQTALTESQVWRVSLVPALQQWLSKPEEVLELVPTSRSLLRVAQE